MLSAAAPNTTAPVQFIWPLLALGRKRGYRFDALVRERLGLTDVQLRDPATRIPQTLLTSLLDAAIARSGERDLGLLAARFVEEHGSAPSGSHPNLRALLESGSPFLPLFEDEAFHSLEVKGRSASVRYALSPVLAAHEAACEFVVALGMLRARRLTGRSELTPIEVHFTHDRPASIRRHERLFRCRLCFGAPDTLMVLPISALELPTYRAEPELNILPDDRLARAKSANSAEISADDPEEQVALDSYVAELSPEERGRALRSGDGGAPETSGRVRLLLEDEDDLAEASTKWVARSLGLSVRTLSRRLRDEGTSYRDILDALRQQSAMRQLARGARSIAEIALGLGFASSQGFHRAFKRWTGTTAASYRQSAGGSS